MALTLLGFALLWMGSTLLAMVLRPKVKTEVQRPTSPTVVDQGEADPLPVVFGTARVKGKVGWWGDVNLVPIRETVQSGGFFSKSKKITVGYSYKAGMQLIICAGPINELVDIIVNSDKKLSDEATFYSQVASLSTPWFGIPYPQFNFSPTHVPLGGLPATGGGPFLDTLPLNSPAADGSVAYHVDIFAPQLFGGYKAGGGLVGPMRFYFGGPNQIANPYLQASISSDPVITAKLGSISVPEFNHVCYAVCELMDWGESPNLPQLEFVVRRLPRKMAESPQGIAAGLHLSNYHNIGGRGDANPAEVLLELLNDEFHGAGMKANFDMDRWIDAAVTLAAEGTGVSFAVSSRSPAKTIIEDVLRHIDGTLTKNAVTGQIGIMLQRPEVIPGFTATEDNAEILDIVFPGNKSNINEVKVTFSNVDRAFVEDVAQAQELALLEMGGGETISETYQYQMFTHHDLAQRKAWHLLRQLRGPRQIRLKVNRTFAGIAVGLPIRVQMPTMGVPNMVFVVSAIDYGEMHDSAIEINAVENIFATDVVPYATPLGNGGDYTEVIKGWVEPLVETRRAPLETAILGGTPYRVGVLEMGIQDPSRVIVAAEWRRQTGVALAEGPFVLVHPVLIGFAPIVVDVPLAITHHSTIWWKITYTLPDGTLETQEGEEIFTNAVNPDGTIVISNVKIRHEFQFNLSGIDYYNVWCDFGVGCFGNDDAVMCQVGAGSDMLYPFLALKALVPTGGFGFSVQVATFFNPLVVACPKAPDFVTGAAVMYYDRHGAIGHTRYAGIITFKNCSLSVHYEQYTPPDSLTPTSATQFGFGGILPGAGLTVGGGTAPPPGPPGVSITPGGGQTVSLLPSTTTTIGGVVIVGTTADPLLPTVPTVNQVNSMIASGGSIVGFGGAMMIYDPISGTWKAGTILTDNGDVLIDDGEVMTDIP